MVEVPRGSRNKDEWDPEVGALRLDRQLFTATRCPGDCGFIPGTRAEDGDALEPGKGTTVGARRGREDAEREISAAQARVRAPIRPS